LQWQEGLRNLWIKKADGKIRLIFSSSSEYKLTGWALSFADEARVVKPKWLVKEVSQTIKKIKRVFMIFSVMSLSPKPIGIGHQSVLRGTYC